LLRGKRDPGEPRGYQCLTERRGDSREVKGRTNSERMRKIQWGNLQWGGGGVYSKSVIPNQIQKEGKGRGEKRVEQMVTITYHRGSQSENHFLGKRRGDTNRRGKKGQKRGRGRSREKGKSKQVDSGRGRPTNTKKGATGAVNR